MAGTGVSAGGGGDVESVGVVGSSSDGSLPLRFLPCRRHGNNGVARTRTSHGNLHEGKKLLDICSKSNFFFLQRIY